MNYKEKYNKLIEAIKVLKETNQSDDSIQNWVDDNVHELTEPADERIRKEIISLVLKVMGREKDNLNDKNYNKMFDWLEKQSKENMVEALRLEYEKGKADALQEQRKEWTAEDLLNRNEIMDILQEYNRDDLIDWLDKLSKQSCNVSPIDNFETEFEKQVSYLIASSINKENNYTADYVKWTANSLLNYAKKEIDKWYNSEALKEFENQGEQNSVDNIKPKFHEGDWLINPRTSHIIHIKDVLICGNKGIYELENSSMSIENIEDNFRLWTIQDAKDGDVLVNGDEIVIFKKNSFNEKDLSGSMFVHCSLRDKKCSWYTIGGINPSNYLPATKEQRDLLFSKMKEAGYEWDAKKKELKEIHVIDEGKAEMDYCFTKMMNDEKASPIWSEDDEEFLRRAIKATKTVYPMTAKWLKSLKERLKGE